MMLLLRSSLALSANRSARELQYAVYSYVLFACVTPHTLLFNKDSAASAFLTLTLKLRRVWVNFVVK